MVAASKEVALRLVSANCKVDTMDMSSFGGHTSRVVTRKYLTLECEHEGASMPADMVEALFKGEVDVVIRKKGRGEMVDPAFPFPRKEMPLKAINKDAPSTAETAW